MDKEITINQIRNQVKYHIQSWKNQKVRFPNYELYWEVKNLKQACWRILLNNKQDPSILEDIWEEELEKLSLNKEQKQYISLFRSNSNVLDFTEITKKHFPEVFEEKKQQLMINKDRPQSISTCHICHLDIFKSQMASKNDMFEPDTHQGRCKNEIDVRINFGKIKFI